MVSLVKIIIERSFVPQVPFEKFSTVGRGERPDRNEVYEVVVRFECAEVLFALWLSCYIHTYIHTYNFICFSRLQKKAAYADVDLLKTYLKYLQHLIGLILQITLKYL